MSDVSFSSTHNSATALSLLNYDLNLSGLKEQNSHTKICKMLLVSSGTGESRIWSGASEIFSVILPM